MTDISQHILKWYDQYKRDLPWRNSNDPYKIWVSEIILQQTRVEQGKAYFLRFMEAFPDVQALAAADEQAVLKLWQGLGYYSRARNLHAAARHVVNQLNGTFPRGYKELIGLKGIGPYTAAAIASFAFNEPVAAVDGNVARVLARLYGVTEPINSTRGSKQLQGIAQKMIPGKRAGDFNQAMIEFGALHCTPKNPQCQTCPLKEGCYAYKHQKTGALPAKMKQKKQRHRYFNYLKIHAANTLFLHKRGSNDIWQNLYEFPLIETQDNQTAEQVMQLDAWKNIVEDYHVELIHVSSQIKHQLSHQRIHCRIFTLRLKPVPAPGSILREKYLAVPQHRFEDYPVPRLISRLLEDETQTGLPF